MVPFEESEKNVKQKWYHLGGGCNPKKPYPSLTFSRVGVGFFWVFSGFFGFLKINNFC